MSVPSEALGSQTRRPGLAGHPRNGARKAQEAVRPAQRSSAFPASTRSPFRRHWRPPAWVCTCSATGLPGPARRRSPALTWGCCDLPVPQFLHRKNREARGAPNRLGCWPDSRGLRGRDPAGRLLRSVRGSREGTSPPEASLLRPRSPRPRPHFLAPQERGPQERTRGPGGEAGRGPQGPESPYALLARVPQRPRASAPAGVARDPPRDASPPARSRGPASARPTPRGARLVHARRHVTPCRPTGAPGFGG
ncbi:hypothetical protein H8959_007097 [Pygathrix nigripes]